MQVAILIFVAAIAVVVSVSLAYILRKMKASRSVSEEGALATRERLARVERASLSTHDLNLEVVDWVRAQKPAELDLSTLVEDGQAFAPTDVVVQLLDEGRAVVYADEARAREFGTVVGRAVQPLSFAGSSQLTV